jgi:hypothetical protein
MERHDDKSNVSRFFNESIMISKQGLFISVELIFNDVKFVNFNSKRIFVGMKLTAVVIVDDELLELNENTKTSNEVFTLRH